MSLVSLSRPLPLRRTLAVSAALTSGVALLSGCGGGGAKAHRLAFTVTGRGGQPVTVKAPKQVSGGLTRVVLRNRGREPLDGQLLRVDGNRSAQDVVGVVGSQGRPIPAWIHAEGGVGQVKPRKTGNVFENLSAGRYYVVASPGEQGKPTAVPLTVKGGRPGQLPKTKGTITAREYTFDTSGLKAGKERVLFRNAGDELHHVVAAPLLPGKTIADVKRFVAAQTAHKRPPGSPPVDMNGGFQTAVLDRGGIQVISLNVKPGRYAFLCFLNDRKGGPPHVMKGMAKEVDIR